MGCVEAAGVVTVAHEIVVSGRVQGVFFRDSLRRVADRHGVTGWVRNEPNGTVRAHLEGAAEDIEVVLEWIRRGGPQGARVDALDLADRQPTGLGEFVVKY